MSWLPIAAAAVSIVNTVLGKNSGSLQAAPPPPPASPPASPTIQSPQVTNAASMASRKAAAAGGIMANIATSPMGLAQPANTTGAGGKTLLGQ